MLQTANGDWRAYFAQADAIAAIDSMNGELDYGIYCSADNATKIVNMDNSKKADLKDTRGAYFPTGSIQNCSGNDSINSSYDDGHPLIRETRSLTTGGNGLGQLDLSDDRIWPFIQVYDFASEGDVEIVYNKGGTRESVTLTFDDPAEDHMLDRDKYPLNAQVLVTLQDYALNIDPTDEDVWTFATDAGNQRAYYNLLNENGGFLNYDPTDNPTIDDFTNYYGNAGLDETFTIVRNAQDEDGVPLINCQDTSDFGLCDDAGIFGNIGFLVNFVEQGSNNDKFINWAEDNLSNLVVTDGLDDDGELRNDVRNRSFEIEYSSPGFKSGIVGHFFGELTFEDPDGVWNSGERIGVTLIDEDFDTNPLTEDEALVQVMIGSGSSTGMMTLNPNDVQVRWVGVPGVPTGLMATPGHEQVTLRWTAPTYNGGAAVTGYAVQYKLASVQAWTDFTGTVTGTTATIAGLTNNLAYEFRVSAINSVGTGSASGMISTTPTATPTAPGAPTGLTATAGNAQVVLSWTAPTNNGGANIANYEVQHRPNGGQWTLPIIVAGTTATIQNLQNDQQYDFQVSAVNSAGTGSPVTATATPIATPIAPGAPTGLTATAGDMQVVLSWTAPASDGGSPITDYAIEQNHNNGGWTTINDGVSTATSYTVTSLTNGDSYEFRVSTINSVGIGTESNVATATPTATPIAPGAPTGLTATAGDMQVVLSWTAPASDGGSPITDYAIEQNHNNGGWTTINDGVSTATSYTVTSLTNGDSYEFRVSTINSVGIGTESNVDDATPTAAPTAPGAPTGLTATAGDMQVVLSWTAPASDGGSPITDYAIEQNHNNGGWTTINDGVSTATSYTVTSLTNGDSYEFRVSAINSVGIGTESNVDDATPTAAPTAPGAPTGLTATAGDMQVVLSWTAPASDGGSPITDYAIEQNHNNGGWTTINDGVSTATSYTVTGLTNGDSYEFRVSAINSVGIGTESNVDDATLVPLILSSVNVPAVWTNGVLEFTLSGTTTYDISSSAPLLWRLVIPAIGDTDEYIGAGTSNTDTKAGDGSVSIDVTIQSDSNLAQDIQGKTVMFQFEYYDPNTTPPTEGLSNQLSADIPAFTIPELSITAVSPSVNEGDDAVFTVTASVAPSRDLSVGLVVSEDGTYVDPTNKGNNKNVIISAGETSKEHRVPTNDLSQTANGDSGTIRVDIAGNGAYTVSATDGSAEVAINADAGSSSVDMTTTPISGNAAGFPPITRAVINDISEIPAIHSVNVPRQSGGYLTVHPDSSGKLTVCDADNPISLSGASQIEIRNVALPLPDSDMMSPSYTSGATSGAGITNAMMYEFSDTSNVANAHFVPSGAENTIEAFFTWDFSSVEYNGATINKVTIEDADGAIIWDSDDHDDVDPASGHHFIEFSGQETGTIIIHLDGNVVEVPTLDFVATFSEFDRENGVTNNARYLIEMSESGVNTGVFEGTIEYIMLNQLNINDDRTYKKLRFVGEDVLILVNEDMTDEDSIRISYVDLGADGVPTTVTAQQEAPTHSGVVSFNAESYKVADTVTITLEDPDLNTDNDVIDIYTLFNDTIGSETGINHVLEVTFDDQRWVGDCGIDGFGDTGFTLLETERGSGVFTGTFQIPSDYCVNDTEFDSVTGTDIEVNYVDFRDASGEDNETGAGASIRANTGTVSFDRTVYPVPIPNNTAVVDANGDPYEPRALTVQITVSDPDFDQSPTGVDTMPTNDLMLKVSRGAFEGWIPIPNGTISEVAPTAGAFELDWDIPYPVQVFDLKDLNGRNLNEININPEDPNNELEFFEINQGDILQVEYTDPTDASGEINTVTDSATFDLRNGVLQSDKSVYIIGSDMILTLIEPDFDLDGDTAESYPLNYIEWDSDAATLAMGQSGNFDPEPVGVLRETGDSTGIFQVVIEIPEELSEREGERGDRLERGEEIELEYVDYGPSGAEFVGDETEDINLTVFTSNFGATIELDQKVYTWTDKIYITIVAPDHNFDSALVDEIGEETDPIRVSTRADRLDNYNLVETGPDTGIFTGEVILIGFDHNADGDTDTGTDNTGYDNPQRATGGEGPTNGFLEADDDDGITVSFEFSEDETVVGTALIRWNIGEVQWLEASYPASGTGVVRVIDPDMNWDPEAVNNFEVDVWSDEDSGGIDLTVTETNQATGIFEGTVFFTTGDESSGHRLRVAEGDTVTVEYEDNTLPDPYTTADELDVTATTLIGTIVPPLERAPASNLRIVDAFENSLDTVSVDQQVQIVADLSNGQDRTQDFAYLVQVQDANGVTVSLAWITGTLEPAQTLSPSASWIPAESGEYTATAFVWESVDNPTALSPPVTTTITVN